LKSNNKPAKMDRPGNYSWLFEARWLIDKNLPSLAQLKSLYLI